VRGYSAIHAGLSYLPLAVSIIVAAGIASQLVTKIGFKNVLAMGMALIAGGLVWFSQITVGGSFTSDILGPSLLAAFGLGFSFVPVTIAAMSGVEEREAGLASGLINTSQQVGGALGLAILSAVSISVIDGSHSKADLVDGFGTAFLAGAGFSVLGPVGTPLTSTSTDCPARTVLPSATWAPAVPVALSMILYEERISLSLACNWFSSVVTYMDCFSCSSRSLAPRNQEMHTAKKARRMMTEIGSNQRTVVQLKSDISCPPFSE